MMAVLRVLAFLPMLLAARMRRIERRTIGRLTDAGANVAERAILLEPGGPLSRFVHHRLAGTGALVLTGDARYYLDEQAYEVFRKRRRRRALVVIAAAMLIGVGLLLMRE